MFIAQPTQLTAANALLAVLVLLVDPDLVIHKVLVANRGEIAIRAFRAAYELGITTVAVYPYEDRNSVHRLKADESYQIGEKGHPVRAYLSIDEIVSTARQSGADAIYPGYGFLSENPELAAACARAGITFIGPGDRRGTRRGAAGAEFFCSVGIRR